MQRLRPNAFFLAQDVRAIGLGGIDETLTLRNVPFGGTLYRIDAAGGEVTVSPE